VKQPGIFPARAEPEMGRRQIGEAKARGIPGIPLTDMMLLFFQVSFIAIPGVFLAFSTLHLGINLQKTKKQHVSEGANWLLYCC